MQNFKDLLKSQWEYIRLTKLGKLAYSLALAAIFFALSNVWYPFMYCALAFMLYPIGLTFVMIAYAWVINPINDYRARNNKSPK
jgi:hypothetical protein